MYYGFDLTEVIPGLENPVLYKLDKKKRFVIEEDVGYVLRQYQSSPFSISRLKDQLLNLATTSNPNVNNYEIKEHVESFIAFLLKESLIVPIHKARDVHREIAHLEACALEIRKLEIIGLELTDYCNFRCPHCSPDSGQKDRNVFLPPKVVLDIIDWAGSANIRELVFTGGEPFAHRDIYKFIEKLGSCQIQSVITTNGSLVSDKHIEAIRNSTIHVRVSLYGGPQYYQAFSPSAKTSARVRKVILNLKSTIGDRVSCVIPVMASNLDNYKERISFCRENKIFYQVNVVCPFGRALNNWNAEKLDIVLAQQIKDEYDKYARKWNPSYRRLQAKGSSKIHIFPCNLNQLNILADSLITPCLSIRNMTIGKYIENQSPNQLFLLFRSQEYAESQKCFAVNRRRICNVCEFKYDCGGGCPAKANAYYGTVNAPDPQCENHDMPKVLKKLQRKGYEVKQFLFGKGGDINETSCQACYQTRQQKDQK